MIIFAHRGSSGEAPENTMAAFRQAIDDGAGGVELDVQADREGEPLVIHDELLGRTVTGGGRVGDLSRAEARSLDAGSWFHGRFAGEAIPELAEVLELFRPTEMIVNIELKTARIQSPGLVERVLELVEAMGMMEQVLLSSFNHHALMEIGRRNPRPQCAALVLAHLIRPWDYAATHGFDALHPPITACTKELVAECHARGLAVRPFTVDDMESLRLCTEIGVDGLFTNYPRRVRDWLEL